MTIAKAPFNYIGNKYRIISDIQSFFPQSVDTMVDLFCGGCDVTINTPAKRIYANDINFFVIGICKEFQDHSTDEILDYIDVMIERWHLSKDNKAGYEDFRRYYNETRKPLDLYILMCYSFNYQFRFNTAHEYNNPFGKNRSCFNDTMRRNLVEFKKRIDNVTFSSQDFTEFDFSVLHEGDFVYADPPYLISCGSYNDGKRGFKGWTQQDDERLFVLLDTLSERGIFFALSNVLEHKGRRNEKLAEWAAENKYTVHAINFSYDNCNYHANNKRNVTKEILITNY